MNLRSDRGAGTALAIGVVATVMVVALAVIVAARVHVVAARVDAATDAAALAAADAALGFADGDPCARAAIVAEANGVSVVSCTLDGVVVTLECVDAGGWPIGSTARAGPESGR